MFPLVSVPILFYLPLFHNKFQTRACFDALGARLEIKKYSFSPNGRLDINGIHQVINFCPEQQLVRKLATDYQLRLFSDQQISKKNV